MLWLVNCCDYLPRRPPFWTFKSPGPSQFDSRMPRSTATFVSLRDHSHINFNQAALRALLNPEIVSSSAQGTQIPVSFVCVYASSIRFLLSPFPIVSVAVWITVFARVDRCLNLFESITKHCSTLLYLTGFSICCLFGVRESPSRAL